MILKAIYITNGKEAFVYDSFDKGINLIHSDDNNKGKTIVTQGIMYALGNVPNFPKGFENFENYFFIVTIENNDKEFIICRKKDSFVVKYGTDYATFESVNEFKISCRIIVKKIDII